MKNVPVEPRPIASVRLVGGCPALDFVNSVHDWTAIELEDYIATPDRYLEWAQRCGLLSSRGGLPIAEQSDVATLMKEVATLRLALFGIFNATIDECPLPKAELIVLNDWLRRAWAGREINSNGVLSWRADCRCVWLPLKKIALSSIDVLENIPAPRLKRCGATTGCGWLFKDSSKNNVRRWCAMDSCGASAKMMRFRQNN